MADNSSIPVASGNETFANKDIAGVKYPQHIQVDSTGAEVVSATAAKQDTGNTSLASILAKIIAAPATEEKQDTANTSLSTLAGAVSSSKVATKAASGDFADGAIATVGAKTDAKSTSTDTTSVSAMSVWKQISASVQAIASSIAGTLTIGLPSGASTAANQTTGNTSIAAVSTTLGAKTDAKSTATDATSISAMQVLKQISAYLAGSLTVATHAVTQSGSWVLSAGSALIGKVQISDGTNHAAVKAASTAPALTDPALVVTLRQDSSADIFAEYETVAASQTDQVLGATGAVGDYLAGVLIIPAAAAAGAVSIKDGNGSSITIFAGGGTVALPTLAPIFVPLGMYSVNSTSAGWKITTGANVSVIGIGNFT